MYIPIYELTWYDFPYDDMRFYVPVALLIFFFLISLNNKIYAPEVMKKMPLIRGGFVFLIIYWVASEIYDFTSNMKRLENGNYKTVSGRVEKIEFAAPNSSYNIIAGTKLFVDSAPTNCYSTAVFGGKYIKVGDYLQIKYYEYDTRWFSIYPVNHCLLQIDKLVEINKDINE